MSKYIWLNKKQEMPVAIMLDKIESLQIQYNVITNDKYALNIYTASAAAIVGTWSVAITMILSERRTFDEEI